MKSEKLQRQCNHSPKDKVFGCRENRLKRDATHELTNLYMSKTISDMSDCYLLQIPPVILEEERTPRSFTRGHYIRLLIDRKQKERCYTQ